ncbi:alpha/beta hydrolase [Anaerolineales bacterium HSG6]|nr:alpha/beta hydrolase [Anaerolineales bacterium HSG6]MDM8531998.1 alpha/beta hydrolase [Anaerolineales bacterium HSG25]
MSAVVIDGGLVHYEAFGRGRPVLFLHGWLGSWRYWMRTMESISDKNRTYALDLWGFGDSDKSKSRYSVSNYVALVDDFVNDMGIREAPIVGHALGASVALEYAVRYPDRAKKIMAISLPVGANSISRKLLDFTETSVVSRMMWWRQRIVHKEVEKELEKASKDAINISMQSVAELDIHSRIQSIDQLQDSMLLTVYGEKDDIIDPDTTGDINNGWIYDNRNIRRIILNESKHFPMLDEASKFNRLLKDFLEGDDLSNIELKEEWKRRHR